MKVSQMTAVKVEQYCVMDKQGKLTFWKVRLSEVNRAQEQMECFKHEYPLSFYDVDFAIINLENARLKILDIIKGIENGNELSA